MMYRPLLRESRKGRALNRSGGTLYDTESATKTTSATCAADPTIRYTGKAAASERKTAVSVITEFL
jgi:hypothetical protein